MAEVKNAFINSKMNQDLDGRLLPSGQYREGVNIQVSKSEGPDVGALENVRGNQLIASFRSLTNNDKVEVIGEYTDVSNNTIYVFLTDYTDPSKQSQKYKNDARNYIFSYNISTEDVIQLIGNTATNTSSWLNFSTTNPIYAINVLEDLLFWTDNRNQPRKLNISKATFTASLAPVAGLNVLQSNYYTTEDQISVAKLYPYECINLYRLNVGKGRSNSVYTGTVINILNSTLSGEIKVDSVVSSTSITSSPTVVSVADATGSPLITAVTISTSQTWGSATNGSELITFTPATADKTYSTSMLDVVSKYLPNGGLATANGTGTSATTITINEPIQEGQYNVGAILSSSSIGDSPAIVTIGALAAGVRSLVLDKPVTWSNDQIITFNANPNYNAAYPGDPDYLRFKFVRFSYRYKFDDGEYSPYAPFTQAAFIPQQDGYFLEGDEDDTFRSTVVDFMQNKVNQVILNIPLPSTNIVDDYKIQEIDIIYKESDGLAVTVLDTILRSQLPLNANFIDYDYQSRKPFKTLPESGLVRVYDKVPVKAFSQEISGNRVIYGNFQDKHTPPNQLNYNVGAFSKSDFSLGTTYPTTTTINPTTKTTSVAEYPVHTLKQNRNYQVGVVLSDRFGRSSTVILSSVNNGDVLDTSGFGSFGGATYFHPYKNYSDVSSEIEKISTWAGDALKVQFNTRIPSTVNQNDLPGYPGLYNGDITQNPNTDGTGGYNPLGWYSYKIVVKQFEQEYYNVYLPGILNGYPNGTVGTIPDPVNTTAFITLINDNINKVPRDLSEVGPEQKQYRSSVQLYGRVTPNGNGATTDFNEQFYPGTQSNTVNTIGEQDFVLGNDAATLIDYTDVYQTISNPYLGRITQTPNNAIGSASSATTPYNFFLGVYETNPTESRINIFWETSTTGLISDLNLAIDSSTTQIDGLYEFSYQGKESDNIGDYVTNPFALQITNTVLSPPVLSSGQTELVLTSVITRGGTTITGKFTLDYFPKDTILPSGFPDSNLDGTTLAYDSYALKTTTYFYYGPADQIAAGQMQYDFNFNTINYNNSEINVEGTLQNVNPVITNCTPLILTEALANTVVKTMTATNGMPAGAGAVNTSNLVFSKVAGSSVNFDVSSAGVITVNQDTFGVFDLSVQVADADGATDTCNLAPIFGEKPVNCGFGQGGFSNASGVDNTGSLSVYWTSDATNSVASTPLSFNTNPFADTDLDLSSTLPSVQEVKSKNVTNTAVTPNESGVFYNTSYNTLINSLCSVKAQSDGGITSGTGFIRVEVTLNQAGVETTASDSTFFGYPIELQYRNRTGVGYPNNWVTARDIEGNLCTFGGTNKNAYFYYGQTGPTGDAQLTGFIRNKSQSEDFYNYDDYIDTSGVPTPLPSTTLEGLVRMPSAQTRDGLTVKAVKNFAVGESQFYGQGNYFGDYRLIIRYPYAAVSPSGYTDYIVLGYNQWPATRWSSTGAGGAGGAGGTINASVKWGDFYYPDNLNTSGATEIPSSYEYFVSNTGFSNSNAALISSPFNTRVFAREWDMKYISQFYRDEALQVKWNDSGNITSSLPWYSYRPISSPTINAESGTQNAATGVSNVVNQYTDNIYRQWTAQFNSDGKKRLGSSTTIPATV
tara:strand:+ start:997 stop:5832 length:4836 start_codon:yes stop_codon:yes gene_type:complete